VHENEAPVLGDMRVVLEKEQAIHPNEASVHRVICAEPGNAVRQHIEEAQMYEYEACVHRNLSPVPRCDSARAGKPCMAAECRCTRAEKLCMSAHEMCTRAQRHVSGALTTPRSID